MKQQEEIMFLCDVESEYAQLFAEYLRRHKEYPWEIRVYTSAEEILEKEKYTEAAMLVVSESSYREDMDCLRVRKTVLLNESGVIRWERFPNINKYQRVDAVLCELLDLYLEIAKEQHPKLRTLAVAGSRTGFIGMYSPVRRCCQTSFALTMSRLLALEHSVLYMNFEHYAGLPDLLPDAQTRDLADLLYFLTAEKDKFRLRMQTMIRHKDGLDYVPPMKAGQNLLTVTGSEWLQLLQNIAETGIYEYVVLDLSESMQGLFDILRVCDRVFTLTLDDRIAQCKIMQYEELLTSYEYEDVKQKTKKCCLPKIKKFPEEMVQYTRGELAEYVKREIAGIR